MESDTVRILREWFGFLQEVGADAVIVFIVVMLTSAVRRVLPGPTDEAGKKLWEAHHNLERYVMPFVPFAFGVLLALIFHQGGPGAWATKPAIKGGLATGAWSLAVERILYKTWFGKTKNA